jgi:hypothetical protein
LPGADEAAGNGRPVVDYFEFGRNSPARLHNTFIAAAAFSAATKAPENGGRKDGIMPSRLIDRFRSESHSVTSGATEVAPEVGASLAERLHFYLEEGENEVDWVLVQKLIIRMLTSKGERLDELDRQLELERAANAKLRSERAKIAARLRRELRSARMAVDSGFEPSLSPGPFRERRISSSAPGALVRFARETAAALRSPELLPSEALAEPSDLAAKIELRANQLEEQLGLLAPKTKREAFAVGAKRDEWQEATSVRQRGQDLLFGLYRGAGFDHLAARLRPKRRRKAEEEKAPAQEGGT